MSYPFVYSLILTFDWTDTTNYKWNIKGLQVRILELHCTKQKERAHHSASSEPQT